MKRVLCPKCENYLFILMKLSTAKANRLYLSVSIAASNLVSGWGKK